MIIGQGTVEVANSEDVLLPILELPTRVMLVNQQSGIVAFRYVYDLPVAWAVHG